MPHHGVSLVNIVHKELKTRTKSDSPEPFRIFFSSARVLHLGHRQEQILQKVGLGYNSALIHLCLCNVLLLLLQLYLYSCSLQTRFL
jgi:hypothetical protein